MSNTSDDDADRARIEADLAKAKALKAPIEDAEAREPRPAAPIDHADDGGVI